MKNSLRVIIVAQCELCGNKPSQFKCLVEGTMMSVCQDCSRYGDVKGKSNIKIVYESSKKKDSNEPDYVFVQNYGVLVKNAREKLNLNQEDFAKKISEHKSLIHQVESEHIKPNIYLARKLEKALHIKIIEEISKDSESKFTDSSRSSVKIKDFNTRSSQSQGMTFADIINKKK